MSVVLSRGARFTAGEALPGGIFLELIGSGDTLRPNLLYWQNGEHSVASVVEHGSLKYKPRSVNASILRALSLPCGVGSFTSERELCGEVCDLVAKFVGLSPKVCSLLARVVMATWVLDALECAPTILLEGPDRERAVRVLRLAHCLCRRGLPMSAVTPTSLCTLPSRMHFTLLIRQQVISSRLGDVLQAVSRRDTPVLRGGQLRDLFATQFILCDQVADCADWPGAMLRVPCVPANGKLPAFDPETQRRVAGELQPKLLAYRFARYADVGASSFDSSKFVLPLRELASTLAATTPTDGGLQNDLHALLENGNSEIRSARWVDLDGVIIESLAVFCREAKESTIFVGQIAEVCEAILKGRGEPRNVDPGEVGRRLKAFGLSTEPRVAQGVRLRISNAVAVRVQELAQELDVPGRNTVLV